MGKPGSHEPGFPSQNERSESMKVDDNLGKVTEELANGECPHLNVAASIEVNPLTDEEGGGVSTHQASIVMACADCGKDFHFVGVPEGMSYRRPMASAGGKRLIAPIAPGSCEPMPFQVFEVARATIDKAEAEAAEDAPEDPRAGEPGLDIDEQEQKDRL